jgi:hypothetical protein
MIHLIRIQATQEQMDEMLQALKTYVKLAVDIQRGILVGGGEMHADCEDVLLDDGSQQEDIWGADWYPSSQEVKYESLINIRPRQNNRSMEIQDPSIRQHVARITNSLLGEI